MTRLSEALKTDTRFHPGIIGVILVMSLLGIAALVSYMEGYRYFDSIYACFITFSLIGFGDINIYVRKDTSKKSNYALGGQQLFCIILFIIQLHYF